MNQHVLPRKVANDFEADTSVDETFIYFLRAGNFVKIGHSRAWKRRMAHMQIGSPFTIVPLLVLVGPRKLEKSFHNRFRVDHFRGEWFHMSPTISTFIKDNLKHCAAKAGQTAFKAAAVRTSWDDR